MSAWFGWRRLECKRLKLLAFGPPIGPEQLDVKQVMTMTISNSAVVTAHRRIAYCIHFPRPPSECAATVYSSYPSRPPMQHGRSVEPRRSLHCCIRMCQKVSPRLRAPSPQPAAGDHATSRQLFRRGFRYLSYFCHRRFLCTCCQIDHTTSAKIRG